MKPDHILVRFGELTTKGKNRKLFIRKLLKNTISEQKIDSTGLILDPDAKTTLAFVDNDETGDRSFSFIESQGQI